MFFRSSLFRFRCFCSALVLLFVSELSAAQTRRPQKTKAAPKVTKSSPDDPSELVRTFKSYGVALRAGNFAGGIIGGGLEAYMNSGAQWQYGMLALYGQHDLTKEFDKDASEVVGSVNTDKFLVTGSLVLLQARYFFTNSFGVTAGLGYRGIGVDYKITDETQNSTWVGGEVNANTFVANIALTSGWAWASGFTIGCDWVGLSYPLYGITKSTVEVSGDISDSIDDFQDSSDKFANDLGNVQSLQFLLVSIGYTF